MDESTLNDLLECSVCLDRLDTTSKVLPCQHTFCRKCLEVIVHSHTELRCPECRVLVEIKIDDLPPNVLLMRILEGMKNVASIQALNSLSNHKLSMQSTHSNQQANNLSSLEANETCGDNGNASNVETKRVSQNGGSEMAVKHNQDHLNGIKLADGIIPAQRGVLSAGAHSAPNNKQILQHCGSSLNTPCAKALYDFDSKEPSDLSFKKGDKIALRRRIDLNWFVGECNGREGVFPGNYVQIMIPLPQPQCKALYDFRMGPNEEEGCLTFEKGAIISVLRRVDQNWAEGRIDDTIGIFPIAFVEMNGLAKQLIDVNKYIHYSTNPRNVPPTPAEQPSNFSSDSTSSTVATSPNSSAVSNSTSSTAPNSPISNNQQLPTTNNALPHASSTPVNHDKRYSFNAVGGHASNTANAGNDQTRHREAKASAAPQVNGKPKVSSQKPTKPAETTADHQRPNKLGTPKSTQRRRQHSPSTSAQHNSTFIPANAFVALYPYKPQKSDELELKKGSIYYVKERCQDGWFKGINRSQKCGVFPGNYVATLRTTIADQSGSTASGTSNYHKRSSQLASANSALQKNGRSDTTHPPELPPRLNASSTTSPPSSSSSSSVWSKPIGQHVEALFGRSQSSSTVNLIKRITNMKRSKSPGSQPSYSMDNPVFEDNTVSNEIPTPAPLPTASSASKRNTAHLSHPVHVRSGSLPIEIGTSSNSSGIAKKSDMFASHRLKAHKERPALQVIRQTMEANNRQRNGEPSSQAYHRKSQSMDAATIAAQITVNADAALTKRKSYTHNEKFKCIVPYPPNSEFELELAIGDIVIVHKKRDNGWFKGTHTRSGKVGLFPSSFVEQDN